MVAVWQEVHPNKAALVVVWQEWQDDPAPGSFAMWLENRKLSTELAALYSVGHSEYQQDHEQCGYCDHAPGADPTGCWYPACVDLAELPADYLDRVLAAGFAPPA